jgi:UDP-N-acetyl-L-fucosamine synthase
MKVNELKIMTIVGTRPEIIKLSCVIQELDKYTEHILVHTGQNYDYELNGIFFEEMGIRKPDIFMETKSETPAQMIGNVIIKSDKLIKEHKPDAILFYGDTNSTLAVISAKKNKVPIFHMEAGNRCFDERVPEEINRKIIDHLSDINMTVSEHARDYLIREGIPSEKIIKVGSCMKEVLIKQSDKIKNSNILENLNLKANNYFVVSCHREENIDNIDNFKNIIEALNELAIKYGKTIIFSTHPRTRKLIESENFTFNPLIRLVKPLSFADYVHLQMHSICVLSDSGTITEEASILKFPAITMRESHERPEGMDEAVVIMSGVKKESILESIQISISQSEYIKVKDVSDYNVDNVSHKVVRIILSYIEYVNRTVWLKDI